ncbi:non-specific serine,threonine protein kinase [Sarracenia purpurea var. burkii]
MRREDVTSFVTGEVGWDMDAELLKIVGCEGSLDESVLAFASHSRKCKQPLDVLPCGIKSTADSRGMDGRGRRLWDRFSSYVKEIIAPCLSSRFQLPKVADSTSVGLESFAVKDYNQVELTGEGIDAYELIKLLKKTKDIGFVKLVSLALVNDQKKPETQASAPPAPVWLNSYQYGTNPPYYKY